MGDDDELGLLRQIVKIAGKPLHVPVVQCRVDLVQQTEGRRPHLQNGEVQRRRHEGFFAAGEQRDGLDLLSGGLDANLNAAGQGIFRVFQNQLSLAAAEHFFKSLPKIVVDFPEFRNKDGGHLFGNVPDDAFQLPLGGQHVVPLGSKVRVALVDPGIFLDGAQVGRTQRGNFPFQLCRTTVSGGDVFNLSPMLRGGAGGQAVGIPQLVHDLLFLHGGSDLLLFQQCAGALHVENVLVLFLCVPLGAGLGGFRFRPVFQRLLHQGVHPVGLPVVFLLLDFQLGDLSFQTVGVLPDGIRQRFLLLPVALHGRPEVLEVRNVGQRRTPLGFQRRFRSFQLRHLSGDGGVRFRRFRLTAFQLCQRLPGLGKLLGVNLNFRLLGGIALPIGGLPRVQRVPLPLGGGLRFRDGVQQDLKLLFLPLQAQHLILRAAKLILRRLHLEFHLVALPLGFLQIRLGNQQLLFQLLFLSRQLFQLICPGQNARFLIHGAAGHRAAGVHDLTVQGDNLEPPPVLLRHGDGRIHIGHDDRPAQQIFHNAPVLFIARGQFRRNAHEAPAIFQPGLL